MLKKRQYKNHLQLREGPDPKQEWYNLHSEILKDSTPFPLPVEYGDIDNAFKEWVEKDLDITFEGERLGTIALFSMQRFSEYMQSWNFVDDDRNLKLNFKVITRENNPKAGTLQGNDRNVVSFPYYQMSRKLMTDDNGRRYFIDYKMKQPFCVDLIYTLSIVTNKYELINEFNMLLNKKFSGIQCYIRPNGHFMPMKMENIADESEYNIMDRRFFSQSYNIRVMAYIINKEDFLEEEVPYPKFLCFENTDSKNSAAVEIEDFGPCGATPYYNQPVILNTTFGYCEMNVRFTIDRDFVTESIESQNVSSFKIRVNDTDVEEKFTAKENDEIYIYAVRKPNINEDGKIIFTGYNPSIIYDHREDNPEVPIDDKQPIIEVDVNS